MPRPPKNVVVSKLEIGRRVQALRRDKHITQAELATILGTHPQSISQVERGIRGLTVHQVIRLSQALGVSPNDLLLGKSRNAHQTSPPFDIRLMRRLQRIKELPPAQRRIALGVLESLLETHGRGRHR